MERRNMIKSTLGLGATLALAATRVNLSGAETQPSTTTPGDALGELTQRMAALEAKGGGTLELGDGVYEIPQPLVVPVSVSLVMTPHAIIRAKTGFSGEAVVIKGGGKYRRGGSFAGWIKGGVIDGNRQPLTGLRVDKMHRLEIADLEVQDCTFKGIHLAKGGNETNLSRVRINLMADVPHAPGSIGLHYERGDSKVSQVHILGYETAMRDDWGSNWFHMIHVWNVDDTQGPLKYAFYCNGGNDAFHMCYADSPSLAGFYINKPNHSVVQCSVYYSRWAPDGGGAAFLLTANGKHGTYLANDIYAEKEHRLGKAFDGDLSSSCILGTRYANVLGGMENRVTSGESIPTENKKIAGPITYPCLNLGGSGVRLERNPRAPGAEEGDLGEVRLVEDNQGSALWVKTSRGWKASKLG